MYERFTDRTRKVMVLANQEAQRLNHEYISTEHILLGLIKEGSGVAANVLALNGLDLRRMRAEIAKLVVVGPDMVTMSKLPQTPRVKVLIERAGKQAVEFGHSHVGTEHILLGLIKDPEGVAGQVLLNMGATFESIRECTMNLLGLPTIEHMRFHVKVLTRTAKHVCVTLFVNGANCGNLTLDPAECERFVTTLRNGAENKRLNVKVEVTDAQESS